MSEIKKENFKRIAEARTNRIIEMISKLSNLKNSSFYEYSNDEVISIFDAIQDELDKQKSNFLNKDKKEK